MSRIYLAYRCSYLYGGAFEDGASERREHLIDADTDAIALTRRVNQFFAQPEIIQQERGNKLEIPAFAMRSNSVHGSGGGCFYNAHLEIRVAPQLGLGTKEQQG